MVKPPSITRHNASPAVSRSAGGSALIVTLVVLVLITILVVSLSSMVGLERATTHESFENQRARELANVAVDEVAATLRDNIPTNNLWAVAPGRLTYFTSQTVTTTVSLCSGQASGATSSTGQVDLNAPILGSSPTSYPIISPNTEYTAAPQMPMGWVEVLQDGTLVRPGTASSTSASNPVIGRYAYWVDTETSKANINTAGRGQSTYNFSTNGLKLVLGTNVDAQNLTGSPSRVDLSELDGGITSAQSMATYHYTYGGYWMPDAGDTNGDYINKPYVTSGTTPPVPVYPQGMHRFNSIQDWALMTNDLIFPTTTVTPITAAQVEANKFYLTTHSYTPEVTPWGFNKMWLQPQNVNPGPASTPVSAYMGNRLNGKGVPFYPATESLAWNNIPGWRPQGANGTVSDSRYYVTPYFKETPASPDFQYAGQYEAANVGVAKFVNNMMVQLNRTDWPGFQGLSFVGKYGQAECEDLAFNALCLYDSCIGLSGLGPCFYINGHVRNTGIDVENNYGSLSLFNSDTPNSLPIDGKDGVGNDGKPRLMGGVGEWPYYSQVSVQFVPTANTGSPMGTGSQFASKVTVNGVSSWTKQPSRPGFAGTWPTVGSVTPYNVAIMPSAQVVYSAAFKNPYVIEGANPNIIADPGHVTFRMIDIAVTATGGKYNGASVTYGIDTKTSGHPYYWGLMEDNFTTTGSNFQGSGVGPFPATPIAFLLPGDAKTINFPTLYIGPFDAGSTPEIKFYCRFAINAENIHTASVPLEIAPMAYNATNAVSLSNQDALYQNIMNSTLPTYAPTFVFDTADDPAYTSWQQPPVAAGLAGGQDLNDTYEVTDPRVSHYLSDWKKRAGSGILPQPASYVSSFKDTAVTGVIGDSSKFAWPDIGFNYFSDPDIIQYFYPTVPSASDPRASQTANNIEGFPGIGWFSVLPTNIESSQGTVASGAGSGSTTPIPWRTLSLEPSTSGQIPDWLLPEAFAIAYDQTFCSQTEGKINVNAAISPQFPQGTTIPARVKPLAAMIAPNTYPSGGNTDLAPISSALTLANAIAAGPGSSNPSGSSLPTDIFMYPGQLCQLNLTSTGGTQWQRESLMRTILSTLTTQSSDFSVHVVAQAVKQTKFSGDPTADFLVTGEQRMSALVSRVTNLGPDNVPDSGWTNTAASFNAANTADENDATNTTTVTVGSTTSSSQTPNSGIGTTLNVTTPAFKYVISNLTYANE
jgi:hypothetical protein